MAALPPILAARTAERFERICQRAVGDTSLAYAPDHLIGSSVRGGVAYDMIGDWNLYSEGGHASRVRTEYGEPDFIDWSMRSVFGSSTLWAARTAAHYNFDSLSSWGLIFVATFEELSGGGFFLGNMVGPNPDDPYYPTQYYGANRGFGISANGDESMGFAIYGESAYMNTDTVLGTIPYEYFDGVPRIYSMGYNLPARTGWLTTGPYNLADQVAAPGVGDSTSPDGMFALGCDYYGTRQANATYKLLMLATFSGDAAQSLWQTRIDLLDVLQETL